MNVKMMLAMSVAAAAAAQSFAAVAHADVDPIAYEFGDASKTVGCTVRNVPSGRPDDPDNTAQCNIMQQSWAVPPATFRSCSQGAVYTFMLRRSDAPEVSCYDGGTIQNIYTVLGPGQSRTAGVITCTGDASGVTCTNSLSGHFYRVSSDSYQVG